ncbi:hypothetical protein V5O48_019458, partial [Marasmius crinis-equi]
LYNSTALAFPVTFIAGDIFDSSFISDPDRTPPAPPQKIDIRKLTSLVYLYGSISAIHTSLLFHLFNKETQARLAKRLAGLLSLEPGSMIFGQHLALPHSGLLALPSGRHTYSYSAESWKMLWEGMFRDGAVDVESVLQSFQVSEQEMHILKWSVVRK